MYDLDSRSLCTALLDHYNEPNIKSQYHNRYSSFKKLSPSCVNPLVKLFKEKQPQVPVELYCELDEQWSFVQNKKQQRWLWYAWSPQFKQVLAYHFGERTDDSCEQLLAHLSGLPIAIYCTDNWGSYEKLIPFEQHLIGKFYTQRIERNNLNLRTRIKRLTRRTICFSKSKILHDKVIGEFINREYFQRI